MPDGISGDDQDQSYYYPDAYYDLDSYVNQTDPGVDPNAGAGLSSGSDGSAGIDLSSFLPDGVTMGSDGSLVFDNGNSQVNLDTGQIQQGGNSVDPGTGIVTDQNGDQWWPQQDGTYANINTGDVYDPTTNTTQTQDSYNQDNSIQANPVSYGNQYSAVYTPPPAASSDSIGRNSGNDRSGAAFGGGGGGSSVSPVRPPTNAPTTGPNPLTDLLNGLVRVLTTPKPINPTAAKPGQATLPGTTNTAAKGIAIPPAISNLSKQAQAALSSPSGWVLITAAAAVLILISKSRHNGRQHNSSR